MDSYIYWFCYNPRFKTNMLNVDICMISSVTMLQTNPDHICCTYPYLLSEIILEALTLDTLFGGFSIVLVIDLYVTCDLYVTHDLCMLHACDWFVTCTCDL